MLRSIKREIEKNGVAWCLVEKDLQLVTRMSWLELVVTGSMGELHAEDQKVITLC